MDDFERGVERLWFCKLPARGQKYFPSPAFIFNISVQGLRGLDNSKVFNEKTNSAEALVTVMDEFSREHGLQQLAVSQKATALFQKLGRVLSCSSVINKKYYIVQC